LVIEALLPRRGVVSRKAAGDREEEQLLAANADLAFLVFALDGGRGFVPRLIERFMALAHQVKAILVLNKADLTEDPEPHVHEAESCAPDTEVLLVSATTGRGLAEMRDRLEPRKTHYFLGKSGVGKSSLINALFGAPVAETGEVREDDQRGRHTTTSRELFLMPGGPLLLDAPGLREAALWADDEGVDASFPELVEFAGRCRFRDCCHSGEPGCAVQAALAEGLLDHRRYESYLELKREARYHQLRSLQSAQRAERVRWKDISKFQKQLRGKRQGLG